MFWSCLIRYSASLDASFIWEPLFKCCSLLSAHLEEDRVQFREDETAELYDAREGERVGQDDGPDLVVGADKVQGNEGEPVDGVDAVGEQDESRLIEPPGTLPGLEGV